MGATVPIPAREKAARCLGIMKTIPRSLAVPMPPADRLTVTCIEDGRLLEWRFPIRRVPMRVREVLLLAGSSGGSNELVTVDFIQDGHHPVGMPP